MTTGLGPSPAAKDNPQHTISIAPSDEVWVARLGDEEIARSDSALLLSESGYAPVVYFPPGDVRTELLVPSDSSTRCPFKGTAAYWATSVGSRATDVAWYYPKVFDEVTKIEGYIAFYTEHVTIEPVS